MRFIEAQRPKLLLNGGAEEGGAADGEDVDGLDLGFEDLVLDVGGGYGTDTKEEKGVVEGEDKMKEMEEDMNSTAAAAPAQKKEDN